MPSIRITEHLRQVGGPLLSHPRDCSVYAALGGKCALIDCGSGEGSGRLAANLAGAGVPPGGIAWVIGTHCHYDHLAGMPDLLNDNPDVRLAVHKDDAAAVENGDPDLTCAGWLYGVDMPRLKVDERLKDGGAITVSDMRFEIIHTPGHSPGSISVLLEIDSRRILFAGDALTPGNDKVMSDYDAWTATLDRLLEADFDFILPGHFTQPLANPFYAAFSPITPRRAGRRLFKLLRDNLRKPVWTVGTFLYSNMASPPRNKG